MGTRTGLRWLFGSLGFKSTAVMFMHDLGVPVVVVALHYNRALEFLGSVAFWFGLTIYPRIWK